MDKSNLKVGLNVWFTKIDTLSLFNKRIYFFRPKYYCIKDLIATSFGDLLLTLEDGIHTTRYEYYSDCGNNLYNTKEDAIEGLKKDLIKLKKRMDTLYKTEQERIKKLLC